MSSENQDVVRYETIESIAIITLNRPEIRNAVNGALARGLEAAIDRLEGSPDIRVGILTHVGPVFCSGADLKEAVAGRHREFFTAKGGFGGLVKRVRRKPLIAAVDGPAVAGGFEFVLACDLVIASSTSTFGLPEVKRSLTAAAGGLIRLPRVVSLGVAMRMGLTGDPITAQEAFQHGLVSEVVAPGVVRQAAESLARRIAANAPLAVQASRQVLAEAHFLPDAQAWELSDRAAREVARTEDAKEGLHAFVERRDPRWTGR